jgi:hypothetical protein
MFIQRGRRDRSAVPFFVAAVLWMPSACSLDWSSPVNGDADGNDSSETGDVAADVDADADADVDADADADAGCTGAGDCPDDGNPCDGTEFCDTGSGACSHRDVPAEGTLCGTGASCLAGLCVPATCGDWVVQPPEECDDGRNGNQNDGCRDDCTFTCRTAAYCDDGNSCNGSETCGVDHMCHPGTGEPDGYACDGGMCCGGICRGGATCCSNLDCPFFCGGSAATCADIGTDYTHCAAQAGCTVDEVGTCEETGSRTCNFSAEGDCTACGCNWDTDTSICSGSGPMACPSAWDRTSCERCGCGWGTVPGDCLGTATPCGDLVTSGTCTAQWGCWWDHRTCDGSYRCG